MADGYRVCNGLSAGEAVLDGCDCGEWDTGGVEVRCVRYVIRVGLGMVQWVVGARLICLTDSGMGNWIAHSF